MSGKTYLIKTGCGNLYVTINDDENGQPFELFTKMGKAGGCASSQAEAIGRLISVAIRADVDPEAIITQLKGISCHQRLEGVQSCSDAIAQAFEQHWRR
jgi:ribonucleoside-diphosphate reductase alpha chain